MEYLVTIMMPQGENSLPLADKELEEIINSNDFCDSDQEDDIEEVEDAFDSDRDYIPNDIDDDIYEVLEEMLKSNPMKKFVKIVQLCSKRVLNTVADNVLVNEKHNLVLENDTYKGKNALV